ncbi:UDP-N-acetylglucosamine--N-acetylmuramyl-(pentapeptide) pyrophosphoryl-undecaprenol N-acetylglucosamine transferase [Actinoplanes teichomyceticus]|uniref:UDP-N-acetylglucosamine--N-acetylmuramyl-(pentapeptide) pyrophosphoryl-undecaprenol N-acetylglucosamine transferase n=1 Tax=Actinoplanes teichomyceticus TaxID=1867 RepID=A0A561WQY2_ACTTI|nr:UDP-N-acetylglucosamine--N-acetylmuramyl-(pentapeptide) pyrophosphoryl-undecaprenol N-acetylglucosamine transferase [Actinoplanes teichomyceticus]TWG26271.1 UDP-N-acetylglucosamine-N-acetylmuramylpentapeptide N-acetylglucosamine transferase [Actinoplanes teichomyceticus]GIF11349.1 UDP-N-acetylglucosamine--N-acetylmuramyl-(pentapeptide) pyrophosphoryl-undecaprenol N-acetylglucosamine transferase [Actinoplanes teichomyceticus]
MSLYSTRRLHALRMIVTGGGTGGHTYPALTTVNALQARLAETGTAPELLWVGVANGLEATIAARNDIPFRAVTTGKLRRSLSPRDVARNLADAFRIPLGIVQAALTVARVRPAVVLSTGGFVSVPIGLAAALFRVPYLMHEQTLSLGLANRILARVATRVLLSHEASLEHLPPRARSRAVVTGNPVRPAILQGNPERGLAAYGLDPAVPLVLVTGGALGAQQINRMLAEALPALLPYCQIVHQCGKLGHDEMREVAGRLPAHLAHRYRVADFIHDELPDLLAAAAIVVARSGAGTVAELTALGKACVLIPYPHAAADEQRVTARHLAQRGAAITLDGPEATPEHLRDTITGLLADPARRAELGRSAATHGRPAAADHVVTEILTAAAGGAG